MSNTINPRDTNTEALLNPLRAIEEKLKRAKHRLLQKNDNRAGGGTPTVSMATWNAAEQLLKRTASHLLRYNLVLPEPAITPNDEGGVSFCWKEAGYHLSVEVSEDPEEPVYFYGDDYGKNSMEGTLGIEQDLSEIILWLYRTKLSAY